MVPDGGAAAAEEAAEEPQVLLCVCCPPTHHHWGSSRSWGATGLAWAGFRNWDADSKNQDQELRKHGGNHSPGFTI